MFPTNTKRPKINNDLSDNDSFFSACDGGNCCSHLVNKRNKAVYIYIISLQSKEIERMWAVDDYCRVSETTHAVSSHSWDFVLC